MYLKDSQCRTRNNNVNYYEPNSTTFLKRLQQNLEDLSQQLQLSNAKNQELTKLIKIVSEERDYYNEQLKKSQKLRQTLDEQFRKQKQQIDTKNLLINQLKRANRELTEQIQVLNQNMQQSKFLFEAQQQQIERIKKQKQLIETEWSRVIKQVNHKMIKIKQKQQEDQKENIQMFANLPLQEKVKKALRRIDREINDDDRNRSSSWKGQKSNWPILKETMINNSSTSGNSFLDEDSIAQ